MADENEIVLRNVGGKKAVKIISNDEGQVVMATEQNQPLQPTNPGGKVDEYAIHDNEADEISALAEKGSPADADLVIIEDSEAGFAKKKTEIGNLGGGGASSFLGLSDTPNDYAGGADFLVGVNSTPDALLFVDPASLPVGAHNHDGVYAPVVHSHSDYLAKVGGIMSGNIDFSDVQEGIRFWDTDSAYFKAFYFDDGFGMITIGDDATGLGGPPQVWAKTGRFNVGFNGFGQTDFGMWEDTAGDFLTVLSLQNGGDFQVGDGDHTLDLVGDGAAPTWNGGAFPAPAIDWEQVPAYDLGSGKLSVAVVNGLALECGDVNLGDSARLSVRDFLVTVKGGAASPTWAYDMNVGAGFIGSNADPTAVFHDFDFGDAGTVPVTIRVSDGTTTRDTVTYVNVTGSDSGGGP